MCEIFVDAAVTSLVVSLLILLAGGLFPFLDVMYGCRWRKYLWLVLAVRLILPFQPWNPEGAEDLLYLLPKKVTGGWLPVILFLVWISGAVLYWIVERGRYQTFKKQLFLTARPVENEQTMEVCRRVWKDISKTGADLDNRSFPVLVSGLVATPMVVGIRQRAVILPSEDYDVDELELIFKHELCHIRKDDCVYKLILSVALGLYWFNPLIHWMVRLAGRDVELVCDSCVTEGMTKAERAEYGRLILDNIVKERYRDMAGASCFYGSSRVLKRRLQNLFDTQEKKTGFALLFAALACLLLFSAVLSGSGMAQLLAFWL